MRNLILAASLLASLGLASPALGQEASCNALGQDGRTIETTVKEALSNGGNAVLHRAAEAVKLLAAAEEMYGPPPQKEGIDMALVVTGVGPGIGAIYFGEGGCLVMTLGPAPDGLVQDVVAKAFGQGI